MSTPDYVVIALYFAGMLAVGVVFARQNQSTGEMFAAGGRSPWWTSGLSAFMTMFSANTFVVWGGIAYRLGMVAVLINLMYGVSAMLVGYFVAGRWRQLGVSSPAEYVRLRYGSGAFQFFTWFMTTFKMLTTAGALYAMGRILTALIPLPDGHVLQDPATGCLALGWTVVLLSSVVILYTMIGGLWAVLMTDVLQFIVLNLAVLFVIPLMLAQVGGPSAALSGLGAVSVDEVGHSMLSPLAGDYTVVFLAGWCVIHFFMIGAEWAFVQRYLCVTDPASARRCAYLFGALYLLSPILWLLPPMLYRLTDPGAAVAGGLSDADMQLRSETAYIEACRQVLPVGMVGMLFAAMFSATASMVSSQLNVFSGVLTNDVVRPLLTRPAEKAMLWCGRLFTALLGVGLVLIALSYEALGGAEKVIIKSTEAVVVALLAPTIWGLFSRRVGASAVWWTAGVGVLGGIVVRLGLPDGGFLTGMEWLQPIAAWVQSNAKLAETFSGVLLPVIVLAALELTATAEAPGVTRLAQQEHEDHQPGASDRVAPSRLPAIVVGWGIALCGVVLLGLIPVNDHSRGMLGGFGAAMLLAAAVILRLGLRPAGRPSSKVAHA